MHKKSPKVKDAKSELIFYLALAVVEFLAIL
jgi:hypothetical protein